MANDRRKKGVPADPYVDEVKRVRTLVCLEELFRVFPPVDDRSLTELEGTVFNRDENRKDGKPQTNGTFHRWLERNSYPDPSSRSGRNTLAAVETRLSERDPESGLPMDSRLREWATCPLWDCLFEEYSPSVQRALLGRLGTEVTEILYFNGERLTTAVVYFPLARLQTLNAFLALLLLSRELIALDRRVEAEVPALLALAIFPVLVCKERILVPLRNEIIRVIQVKYWTTVDARLVSQLLATEKGWQDTKDPEKSWVWMLAYMHMNAIRNLYTGRNCYLSELDTLALTK